MRGCCVCVGVVDASGTVAGCDAAFFAEDAGAGSIWGISGEPGEEARLPGASQYAGRGENTVCAGESDGGLPESGKSLSDEPEARCFIFVLRGLERGE